ncbi:trace amine-associated receptor 1-like [Erpetoichthys calabaricus]|uniref:trace amine-associated receptor 1-like n=1 Tax=Erpetoichthys calabaricus TaxID=27687 RepID=UPI0010A09483|nr:trace amine-associated receptor 1-like [Erpetoichthys calabaricus]
MNFNNTENPEIMQFCYVSVNNSCRKFAHPVHTQILIYATLCTAIIVTICGNLLVIISISHFKELHTPTNYLILSLAVVDFLLGGFIMPPFMVLTVETCWYFGEFFCKIHYSSAIMLCTASIIHLSIISIDRYYAVCHPLKYKIKVTTSVTFNIICVSWIISAVLGFGIVLLELNLKGIEDFYKHNVYCKGSCVLMQNETSGLLSSLLSFYIPGFIMVCIYIKIFKVARRQAKSITVTIHQSKRIDERRNAESSRRETKAARTLAIVLGVFLICWSPFFLCNIVDPLIHYTTPPLLINILLWCGYLNSSFNPLVYGFFYSWFRKALKMIALGQIFQNDSSMVKLFTT